MHFLNILYLALVKLIDDDGVEHAGYMSFMVLLSLFPFMIFFLALTSFLGGPELGKNFVKIFITSIPKDAVLAIENRVQEILQTPPPGLMTIAVFGTVWTASSFVEGLRTILNKIYEVATPPNYLWRRFLSIIQFLTISIILSAVMLILVIIPSIFNKLPGFNSFTEGMSPLLNYARYAILYLSLFGTVSILYYVIPNVKLNYQNVIPGSLIASLLLILAGYIISSYIIYYTQLSIIYGSLGSIIVTLLFFYIIHLIFIYGAEFNFLYKQRKINENNIAH